jgi:hypothetical protein
MTQNANDVEIANQGFAAFRQDLNDVLEDITTLHSGNTAPTTTYANQWWYELDTDKLYIRNEDNDAWIEILTLDQANDHLATIGATITLDGAGNMSVESGDIVVPNDDILCGQTTSNFNAVGVSLNAEGAVRAARTSGASGSFNRLSTDGTLINLYKNGANFGTIGVTGGDNLYIAGNSSHFGGIGFGTNALYPVTDTGSVDNGYNDIGEAAARWKDLYLSGGVYLGGTGAANKLDDYEEGFWTPTFSRGGTALSPTPSYSTREGTYTKIGDFVHVSCEVRFNNNFSGGSGGYLVSNLPFTAENQLDGISWGLMTAFNNTWTFTSTFAYVAGTKVQFSSNMSLASSTNDGYLCFSAHYKTA